MLRFVNSRVEGWAVASFTRTEGDLEADTLRPGHLVTGPFIARYLHICNIYSVSIYTSVTSTLYLPTHL